MESISVLCVDDDQDLVALTATRLERVESDLDVSTVTHPEAALDTIEESTVDCVVSDYDMPAMDGIALLEAVRSEHPDLPFILFTGKGSEEVASEAIASGVTDYLQKGAGDNRYELLANRVTNAVEQYRASKRAASLDRIRSIIRDVNRSLVRAEDREAIEHRVSEIVATADPYQVACIVSPDGDDGFAVRAAVAETGGVDDQGLPDPPATCPVAEAIETDEIATVVISADTAETAQERQLDGVGYRAAGTIPITYNGHNYGALCLFTDATDAFDREERALLREIGDDLAHATYRAELTDRLRRNERIISNLPVGVYRNTPLPDGTLLTVNPAMVDLFDADDESDLRGRPFRDLYADPDDREQFLDALRRDSVVQGMELELETLSGDPFWASVTGIMTDEGDERYFDGVVRDVTGQRERERSLKAYERAVELAPVGIFRTSADGDVLDANPTMAELLGFGDAGAAIEFYDDLEQDLYADPERREAFLDRLREGSVSAFTFDALDGDENPVQLSISAVTVDDGMTDGVEIVGFARPAN